ncbi:NAD(P)-dependent oxidoreductase [Sphingomonas flavalba]|uniref:NAD(P)-dependent oxidoreductase n=1 Tax=Sphingomonas flavalba TaxID=2559804 RepID=UPI0039E16DE2
MSRRGGSAYAAAQTDDPVARHPDDFYPTHPGATQALLRVETFDGAIWEPACGTGDMSKVLEASGYQVVSTDLIDRGYGEGGRDFLMEWNPIAPNICTNPPFRWAVEFADRALQLTTGKVALFLRLAFLEGVDRGRWFPNTPLARVWVMSRRVPMQRGRLQEEGDGHGVIAFAWFVWEHGHSGAPTLGFLDWKAA